jgi:ribosomal protein L37AE/L43A
MIETFMEHDTKHLCPKCKKVFTLTVEQKNDKYFYQLKAPYHCPECSKPKRLDKNAIRICKTCGQEFTLTDIQIKFYESKNLSFPKNCRDCLLNKRKEREHSEYIKHKGNNNG